MNKSSAIASYTHYAVSTVLHVSVPTSLVGLASWLVSELTLQCVVSSSTVVGLLYAVLLQEDDCQITAKESLTTSTARHNPTRRNHSGKCDPTQPNPVTHGQQTTFKAQTDGKLTKLSLILYTLWQAERDQCVYTSPTVHARYGSLYAVVEILTASRDRRSIATS